MTSTQTKKTSKQTNKQKIQTTETDYAINKRGYVYL